MNKYLSVIALATLAHLECKAQPNTTLPRLVVSITVDQLNSNDMEHFAALYGNKGLRKLLREGRVYENAQYDFTPVDMASAVTALSTGASPNDNGITARQWLSRETLRPVQCTFDKKFLVSPGNILSSTIADELKLSTNGSGLVYSIAVDRDAAVLQGGHAADGAFWRDEHTQKWTTSAFYPRAAQTWIDAYQRAIAGQEQKKNANLATTQLAIDCINDNAMGRDDVSDLLFVTLSARTTATEGKETAEWTYRYLDTSVAELIEQIENKVGKENVVFLLTSTGCTDTRYQDYARFNIPSGTFYINRTANLLNIYLNALYGESRILDGVHRNEIYLNKRLLEQKRINLNEVLSQARDFLIQSSGVKEVYTAHQLLFDNRLLQKVRNGFNHNVSGDLLIQVAPGWKIYNEETREELFPSVSYLPFPIILYGAGIKPLLIETPVTTNRIAPTLARTIRIRAPNACAVPPLP